MKNVPCKHCQGTGHRILTDVDRETLAVVGIDQAWHTSTYIRARLGDLKISALANRLNKLRTLDMVIRRRSSGRSYEWKAAS